MPQAFYEACRDITDSALFRFGVPNECPLHFHGQVAMFLIDKGKYEVTVNDVTKILTPSDIFFTDSFDSYSVTALEDNSESTLITVPNRYLNSFEKYKSGRAFAYNFITEKEAKEQFRDLVQIMKHSVKANNQYLTSGVFQTLLGLLVTNVPLKKTEKSREVDFMRKVVFYIKDHMTENIVLESVATAFGYSENYFSTLFHNSFHTNFRTYLGRIRVNYADYLISEGTPIITAALNAGFNSVATFYRVYIREYGIPPTQKRTSKTE